MVYITLREGGGGGGGGGGSEAMCVVVIVGMDTRFSNSHCRKQYASQWKVRPPRSA